MHWCWLRADQWLHRAWSSTEVGVASSGGEQTSGFTAWSSTCVWCGLVRSRAEQWIDALVEWLGVTEERVHCTSTKRDADLTGRRFECVIASYNFVGDLTDRWHGPPLCCQHLGNPVLEVATPAHERALSCSAGQVTHIA